MVRISIVLFLCFATGCRSKDFTDYFQHHAFDPQVIKKLPVYDSLGNVILQNYSSIHQYIRENNSYKYIFSFDSTDVLKEFPKEGAVKIKELVNQLGEKFIYGFEVYRDSSIKIYIRDYNVKSYHLNVMERLSFYPDSSDIKKRKFPFKDTILDRNWEYWILFDNSFTLF